MSKERIILDTSKIDPAKIDRDKISDSPEADQFRKATIKQILESSVQEKSFSSGELVVTLEGNHAHKGLKVVEVKENGVVKIAPAPGAPIIEMSESELFHFEDYGKAFEKSLEEEQTFNPDRPQ